MNVGPGGAAAPAGEDWNVAKVRHREFGGPLHLLEAKDDPKMFGHDGERKSQPQHGLLRPDVRRPDDADQPAQRKAPKAKLDRGSKTFSGDPLTRGKPEQADTDLDVVFVISTQPKGEAVTITTEGEGALTAYVTYPHWAEVHD
ncbi:hypothetical protein LZK73_33880 (plasmid) [Neorhizobium galegae]|nr:hypothetical protein LZK73_33880 [Neorhizobium galegae]